jgi:threonine synthase
MNPAPLVDCAGCGAVVDPSRALPFRCPNADGQPDIDHVLTPRPAEVDFPSAPDDHPFRRYAGWTLAGRLARWSGLTVGAYAEIVDELDAALVRVGGVGLTRSPFAKRPALAKGTGVPGLTLWTKTEAVQPAGSHKIRHLMAVMLYLRVLEAAKLPAREGLRRRPLAIASCGNAALAAATMARAADWPLDVFIPPDASPVVVRKLRDLGARIQVCDRAPGELGDPCFTAFRKAVAVGALPFGAQGPENGLSVEGSRLIAYEIAEDLAAQGEAIDAVYVQVGGGAFASGIAHGFAEMEEIGAIAKRPRLVTVQTEGCHPLNVAYQRLTAWRKETGADARAALAHAAAHRTAFMAPWPTPPHSVAHGILDDETYDWLALVEALDATGGETVIASETDLEHAYALAKADGFDASHTGIAGLAGVLARQPAGERVAVIVSGVDR